MLKKIDISDLVPGMYVTEIIAGGAGAMPKKKQGMVRDPRIIDKFKEIGVVALVINTAKSVTADKKVFNHQEIGEKLAGISQQKAITYQSINLEWGTAKEIFATTSTIISQSLDLIRESGGVDVEYFGQACDAITRSLQRNKDALTWLGRLRDERNYLFEHSVNCAILMGIFARARGMKHVDIQNGILGALMHDLGQAHIEDELFYKPGALTDDEFETVKTHVSHTEKMVSGYGGALPESVYDIVKYHHERWDGNGYPYGLAGEDIPIMARMFAIVDTYDAITTQRCHKDAVPSTKCMRTLLELSGNEFDQGLVHQFIKCLGVYPTGSLVKLNDKLLAIVIEQHPDLPIKPLVKVIYNSDSEAYVTPYLLNLSHDGIPQKIESYEDPAKYGIKLDEFVPSESDF